MSGRLVPFPGRPLSTEEGNAVSAAIFAVAFADRAVRAGELKLEEPETLLALCGYLRRTWSADPARTRDEAEFLYRYLEIPRRPIGLFDEREYFLGEAALIAGTCCRFESDHAEALRWFDRAESAFRHTVNAVADWARVSLQRLALQDAERRFDEVLELGPSLVRTFEKVEMRDDALRSRLLVGLALAEAGRDEAALAELRAIAGAAESAGVPAGARAALSRAVAALAEGRRDPEALRGLRRAFDLVKS